MINTRDCGAQKSGCALARRLTWREGAHTNHTPLCRMKEAVGAGAADVSCDRRMIRHMIALIFAALPATRKTDQRHGCTIAE